MKERNLDAENYHLELLLLQVVREATEARVVFSF